MGWFKDTVPRFFQSFKRQNRLVLHLDADLYSSTLLVMFFAAPFARPDDIIIFDELGDYMNKFRAFYDFTRSYPLSFRLLVQVESCRKVALILQ